MLYTFIRYLNILAVLSFERVSPVCY